MRNTGLVIVQPFLYSISKKLRLHKRYINITSIST
ncbi:hypothetical protein BACOVA_05608 [Bacteroides ovatus ATCC 8483]|uniref:Uncharacterized protein n=1 Tax=Bacteroides ovatus (strain ATCC 8483 / DSM 1896 / JCM 5824 / BCRC 10623 / CCUG 4943 / NCTC 11153) TaxID=411476 RepID=A0AAN3D5U6_BACO1|nr:hypothetical protein BACOVA_05608 [Bacteroides ovatus ATCC 8483]